MAYRPDLDLRRVAISLAACYGLDTGGYTERFSHLLDRAPGIQPDAVHPYLEEAIALLASGRDETLYLSTPITTGIAYLGAAGRRNAGPKELPPREVNRRRAAAVADRLRSRLSQSNVIDPTHLIDIPGWTQADYHGFWESVIEKYVDRIAFIDGWQYSAGCSIEFVAAVRTGLPLADEVLEPLTQQRGSHMLREALLRLEPTSMAFRTIRCSIDELGSVTGGAA